MSIIRALLYPNVVIEEKSDGLQKETGKVSIAIRIAGYESKVSIRDVQLYCYSKDINESMNLVDSFMVRGYEVSLWIPKSKSRDGQRGDER
jgi:hypothetical protein